MTIFLLEYRYNPLQRWLIRAEDIEQPKLEKLISDYHHTIREYSVQDFIKWLNEVAEIKACIVDTPVVKF